MLIWRKIYPQPNWITLNLENQTVNLCIDYNGGCPDNPSGNNYFIGLYSVPANYAGYLEHEPPALASYANVY